MAALVGKSIHGVDRLSNQFLSEIFDEVAFQFNCNSDKQSHIDITSRSANKKSSNNSEMKMM